MSSTNFAAGHGVGGDLRTTATGHETAGRKAPCTSCEDGWVYVDDAARACSCRRPVAGYGGQTRAAERRQRAQKAGRASGIARRQRSTCKRQPRQRSRQHALALKYKIRQVGAEEFERRYRRMCEAQGLPCDTRGLRTSHELYKALLRAYRVQGQDWETTNAQLSRAMEIAGRGRARSTIQRTRKRLTAMGLIAFEHVKRSGALRIVGKLDTLRCRCLCPRRFANDTPPTGAGAAALRPAAAPACTSKTTAEKHLIPPPSAADDIGPATPAATRERLERYLDFLQLKLELGFGHPLRNQLDQAKVKRQLRQLDGSGQDTALTFRNRSLGFK